MCVVHATENSEAMHVLVCAVQATSRCSGKLALLWVARVCMFLGCSSLRVFSKPCTSWCVRFKQHHVILCLWVALASAHLLHHLRSCGLLESVSSGVARVCVVLCWHFNFEPYTSLCVRFKQHNVVLTVRWWPIWARPAHRTRPFGLRNPTWCGGSALR